jgi:tetratricopeptide (TPR) repeat protein
MAAPGSDAKPTNYDKWDKLDLHDDEDVSDCHPNIDGKLWLRLKREKKEKEWYEEDQRAAECQQQQAEREPKLAELQKKLDSGDETARSEFEDVSKWYEAGKETLVKYEEKKQWRSTEVSELAEESVTVESKKVARQEEVAKMPIEERLVKANEGKEAGTALFKQQKFEDARDAYHAGFELVVKIDYFLDHPESLEQAKQLKLSLSSNLAAVCLKINKYGQAAAYANRALEVDPENPKVLYRRGQAHLGSRDYDKAKADLLRAAKLAPKDKAIRKAYEEAKQKVLDAAKPPTEEEEGDAYMNAIEKNEEAYKQFAALRRDDASQEFIGDHPELLTQHATGWMLLKCLELEMEGKHAEMCKVARQNEMLEYITRSCGELKIVDDVRAAVRPFFQSLKAENPKAREGFESDMNGVIEKITERAKVKLQEQDELDGAEEIIVEKIIEDGIEYLVDKKGGAVFRMLEEDGETLEQVGSWDPATERIVLTPGADLQPDD